jgi:hypothetical protein
VKSAGALCYASGHTFEVTDNLDNPGNSQGEQLCGRTRSLPVVIKPADRSEYP